MSGGGSNVYNPSSGDLSGQNSQLNTTLGQNATALNGYAPAVSNQAQSITSQYQNNPYQAQAQAGAGVASAYGTGTVAPAAATAGMNLQGLGNINASYAPQALQTGFDPQNALYNRNYQQTMDQTNALNSISGVSNTPYGASVAGNVGNNFNLDWQNQALQRQATGAGTAQTLTGAANTAYTGAAQQGANALNTYNTAASLPSQTYQQNLNAQLQELSGQNSAVSGATSANDALAQQIQSYLQYGTGAQQTNYQDSASSLSGLGSLFGTILGLGTGGGKTIGGTIFSAL